MPLGKCLGRLKLVMMSEPEDLPVFVSATSLCMKCVECYLPLLFQFVVNMTFTPKHSEVGMLFYFPKIR